MVPICSLAETQLVLGRGRDFDKLRKDSEKKEKIKKAVRRSSQLRIRDLKTVDQTSCTN
jgi:hypothetical protein